MRLLFDFITGNTIRLTRRTVQQNRLIGRSSPKSSMIHGGETMTEDLSGDNFTRFLTAPFLMIKMFSYREIRFLFSVEVKRDIYNQELLLAGTYFRTEVPCLYEY